MREINNFFKIVFLIFFSFTAKAESKILSIGNPNAKVIVKVFSSLTCPHCADFHTEMSDAFGLTRDMGPIMGRRAARCAMVVDHGFVQSIFIEEPGAFELSSAEHVLASL